MVATPMHQGEEHELQHLRRVASATAWTGLLGTIVLTTCMSGDSVEPAAAGADSTRLAASAP